MQTYSQQILAIALSFGMALLFMFLSLYLMRRHHKKVIWRQKQLITQSPDSVSLSENYPIHQERSAFLIKLLEDTFYGRFFTNLCIRAGLWSPAQIQRWVARKFEFASAGLILALLGIQLINLGLFSLILLSLIGFFLPDYLLFSKGQKRTQEIIKSLPETIDLLNMTVGAGLGFQAGLDRISKSEVGPLSDEFRRVLGEIRLGASRSQAFAAMSQRVNRPELWSFTNAISQVEKLGIPITNALRDQAKTMRVVRKEKAREIAQKLPVKILAPIMLLLLPSVLVIVLAPAILTIMNAI